MTDFTTDEIQKIAEKCGWEYVAEEGYYCLGHDILAEEFKFSPQGTITKAGLFDCIEAFGIDICVDHWEGKAAKRWSAVAMVGKRIYGKTLTAVVTAALKEILK